MYHMDAGAKGQASESQANAGAEKAKAVRTLIQLIVQPTLFSIVEVRLFTKTDSCLKMFNWDTHLFPSKCTPSYKKEILEG